MAQFSLQDLALCCIGPPDGKTEEEDSWFNLLVLFITFRNSRKYF